MKPKKNGRLQCRQESTLITDDGELHPQASERSCREAEVRRFLGLIEIHDGPCVPKLCGALGHGQGQQRRWLATLNLDRRLRSTRSENEREMHTRVLGVRKLPAGISRTPRRLKSVAWIAPPVKISLLVYNILVASIHFEVRNSSSINFNRA